MPRYFIEVSYKGTHYSGFQIQQNANTIQAEIEKALKIFFKRDFDLTGSSRTDAGVHALQNFFHVDFDGANNIKAHKEFEPLKVSPAGGDLPAGQAGLEGAALEGAAYNLNALLPKDICIKKIFKIRDDVHCRFDAISREYKYYLYQNKDPFLQDTAFYFPYRLDIDKLQQASAKIINYKDFTSFSKQNTQVNNFICSIYKSEWSVTGDKLIYTVVANRFLRGMVKGLVGTMLRVATGKISLDEFEKIIGDKDQSKVDFSPPSHGLFLHAVNFDYTKILD